MGKSSNSGQGSMMTAFADLAAAQMQYQLGSDQLAWAKDVYNENKPAIQASSQAQLDAQTQANQFSKQQENFYTNTYQPMEAAFADTANNWDTTAREQQNAGSAEAAVSSQFDQARTAAQSQLESFGVDPSATRYAALDAGTRAQQAAASASAGNNAIQQTQQQGLTLKSQAINTGRGYPSAVNQTTSTGSSAGSAGVGALNSSYSTAANAMNGASTWFNAGNQAMANSGNAWGNYNTAQQGNRSGIGSMLGGAMGLASSILAFDDGGSVPDPSVGSQQDGYAGQTVPSEASPTGGKAIDDVPARLNVGEFVIPNDVVKWEGEKAIYTMIEKAQKERAQKENTTTIRPDVAPARQQAIAA